MAPHSTMIFNASSATQALELAKAKNEERRGSMSSVDSKLSCDLSSLLLDESSSAFPVIQWDMNDDTSDSESVRSMGSWNSFLGGDDSDSVSSSGSKRGRSDSGATRRLVRSRKIKSDLSLLAPSMDAARSA